jgi:hypothetical protein
LVIASQGTRFWSAIVTAIVVLIAATPVAKADQFKPVIGSECEEVNGFVEVPLDNVEPFLPKNAPSGKEYVAAAPDRELGLASVFIDGLRCGEMDAGPHKQPMLYATVSISIDPPEGSTSSLAGSSPGPNFYLVSWATDDRRFADWLRHRTGLGDRVALVPGLSYEHSPVPAVDPAFRFRAPAPSPTPLELSAAVSGQIAQVPVIANYWRETSEGAVRIETSHLPDPSVNQLGVSAGIATSTDPSSDLTRLFGGLQNLPFEGLTAEFPGAKWTKYVFR